MDYSRWNILSELSGLQGACGTVVGWGTMLQAGRSPVRVPDDVDFSIYLILPPQNGPGSMQPLTGMSTRNLRGGKKRPARRADNLAAICEPNVCKCGSLNVSQPKGLHSLYRDNVTVIGSLLLATGSAAIFRDPLYTTSWPCVNVAWTFT
jgi:hypothetical protein